MLKKVDRGFQKHNPAADIPPLTCLLLAPQFNGENHNHGSSPRLGRSTSAQSSILSQFEFQTECTVVDCVAEAIYWFAVPGISVQKSFGNAKS